MRSLRVRHAAAALAVAGLSLGLTAGPVGAADLPISGSISGSGELEQPPCVGPPDSANIGASFAASGTLTSLGDTLLDGTVCLTTDGGASRVFGPLVLQTGTGTITATMTGTGTGSIFGAFDWDLTATVDGGTGEFEGATGTLSLAMHLEFVFPLQWTGTIDGTVTLPPHTPTSHDDCRDGRWRDFEDEHGAPFRNQGQCVAWVNHHL
jgi:hypothetical protein